MLHSEDPAAKRTSDDEAFIRLYRDTRSLAWDVAHRILRDADLTDDVVQEAYCQLLHALRAGKGPDDSARGYVFTSVRRLAYRQRIANEKIVLLADPIGDRPRSRSGDEHTGTRITAAWQSLPRRWRYMLWLVDVDGYTPAELAPALRITPSAVSSLVLRARRALRQAYLAPPDHRPDLRQRSAGDDSSDAYAE